jgi:hypothetical protein
VKLCIKQNANGDEILCETKEKVKKTMVHMCIAIRVWFKIIVIIILFHHKMELAIVFVFQSTH